LSATAAVVRLSSLSAESEGLVEYRADLVKELQSHKKYQQYMSKVLEVAGDFHEISEIMSRYQTLLATYEVLARKVILVFLVHLP